MKFNFVVCGRNRAIATLSCRHKMGSALNELAPWELELCCVDMTDGIERSGWYGFAWRLADGLGWMDAHDIMGSITREARRKKGK